MLDFSKLLIKLARMPKFKINWLRVQVRYIFQNFLFQMLAEWLKIRKQEKTYFINIYLVSISHQCQE